MQEPAPIDSIPLQEEHGRLLMLVLQDFHQRLAEDLQQRGVAGIPAKHRAVFLHLARFGPSRSVDLAGAAGIRPQSMMAIVDELEQAKLVLRRPDPSDSRAKLIHFTAKGKRFIAELSRSTNAVWEQYAALLGRERLTQTFTGLKLLESLAAEERNKP